MAENDHPQPDGTPAALRASTIAFLEQQIDKLRETAPAWVRAIVYFMFCAAFIVVLFRFTAGDYVVGGHVELKGARGAVSAVGYEVKVDHLYAVNSNGDFYAVMSIRDFMPLLLTGKLTAKVYHASSYTRHELRYRRWSGTFEDLDIPIEGTTVGTPPESLSESRGLSFDLIPSAFAEQATTGRLIIESVRMGKLDERGDAEVYVRLGDDRYDLRYIADTITVPLRRNEVRQLGQDYFCPIPWSPTLTGYVSVKAHTGFFSSVHERFRFKQPLAAYNVRTSLPGDDGGEMIVRLASNYDFVLYRRGDIAPRSDALRAQLESAGFRVIVLEAGDRLRTNVLYLGPKVPFTMARSVIALLARENVALAVVKRRSSFKNGNNLQMELGAQKEKQGSPQLTPQQIEAMLSAKSEGEFARATM
jgi:hypothetical protein